MYRTIPTAYTQKDWDRFWKKTRMSPSGCIEWTSAKTNGGYGLFGLQGGLYLAHRVLYHWMIGPVPEDKQLDHLCSNPACVNPLHLEPVTQSENIVRALERTGRRAKPKEKKVRSATHFPCGHERSEENMKPSNKGCPVCRTCARESTRRWHEAHPNYMKEWFAAHPDFHKQARQRRRDRKALSLCSDT